MDGQSRDAKLRGKAYRLLARREHSAFELRRKLCAKSPRQSQSNMPPPQPSQAELQEMVAQLIDELRAEGAQSDARFAEQLARRRFQTGRGPLKLRAELLAHEIDAALIARVMGEYETQWAALAVEVRRRKFGEQAPTSFRDWAKQARFLQQRGFDASHIEPFAH